jgi:restriction system protein
MFVILSILVILLLILINTFSSKEKFNNTRVSTPTPEMSNAVIEINKNKSDNNTLGYSLLFNQKEINKCRKKHTSNIEYLRKINPHSFEDKISKMYRELGWNVYQTSKSSDGGKDAIMTDGNVTFLLECKRYSSDKSVGRPDIQKFHSAVVDYDADGGFIVTTSHFSPGATRYAKRNGITLIDSKHLSDLYESAYPSSLEHTRSMCTKCGDIVTFKFSPEPPSKKCPNDHTVKNLYKSIAKPFVGQTADSFSCARCGSDMILRKGSSGKFWGCTKYPNCKHTTKY